MASAAAFDYDDHTSHLELMERLDRLSWWLDSVWRIPGTDIRFGADAVMGLVPGIGDLAGAALGMYIIMEARSMNLPGHVIARMIGNVGLDTVVGAVPIAGSIFDVAYRANRRNMKILRDHLAGISR